MFTKVMPGSKDLQQKTIYDATLKTKTTYNLSHNIIDKLDKVWLEIRKDIKSANKSIIVELALTIVFEEYNFDGKNSRLFKSLK